MSLIPKTLSQDMRHFIDPGMNESQLLEKLKRDPKTLIKFFQQAAQNFQWLGNHKSFATKLVIEIRGYVLHQIIPWDILKKIGSGDSFLKRVVIAMPDLNYENRAYSFSRLVMIRECEHLRNKWLSNPDEIPQASDIATHITIVQAAELFKTMCTDDFHQFQKESVEVIQKYLLQAKVWGYERGIVKLQELLCEYVGDLSSLFGLFLFSTEYGFANLTQHCLSTLENTDFFLTIDAKGKKCLTNYELFSDLNSISENLTFTTKMKEDRFNSYWDYPKNSPGVIFKQISFKYLSDGVVVSQTYSDSCDIEKKKEEMIRCPKVKLDKRSIKILSSDGKNKVSLACIGGMLRYFDACYILKITSYSEVTYDQLLAISEAKRNFTALIFDESKIADQALNQITVLFPYLTALTINHHDLSKENLNAIMNSNIDYLSFSYCIIELPENLNEFTKLTYLGINHVKTLAKSELKRLFDALIKLNILHAVGTKHFCFEIISNPEYLEEMIVDSELIESYRIRNDKTFLHPFKKLASISIFGSLSPDLKGFLTDCIRERPNVIFKFFPTRVQD